MSRLLQDVVGELSKLPGVGRRTALRLAIHILRMERESVAEMTESIDRFRNEVKYCTQCNNLSDEEVCPICADDERDHTTICVVEQVADVLSVENTRQYKGLYHVLGGVISPMQGISPSDLKIDLLTERIARGGVKEVILAISTSVEGETTLFYLMNRLRQFPGLKVTSIARGIGFGDELEYVDELTITHALLNRREVECPAAGAHCGRIPCSAARHAPEYGRNCHPFFFCKQDPGTGLYQCKIFLLWNF